MLAASPQAPQRPYRPRAPASGLFHRLVREHLATLLELRPNLPRHVVEAFEAFLDCGILAHGFARLRCGDCGHERLLPFSCKGRLCPSCNGRRMYDTAAHLVDRVLPPVGYRQWVLSLPRRVRYLLVTRPELVTSVLGVFQRMVFAWQRRRARRAGVGRPLLGSVTCIQRFGDALNLNLHFHSYLPDGVFSRESDGAPVVFFALAPPTTADLDRLVERLWRRISKKLADLGAWEPQLEDGLDPERAELGRSIGEQLVAFDPIDEGSFERKGLSAFRFGYSLHAGVAVAAEDRSGLERILRYGLRPPFAEHRLEEGPRGEVYYRLESSCAMAGVCCSSIRWTSCAALAAFVPPKGQNLVRYHGVFAPNSKHRGAVVRLVARAAAHPVAVGERGRPRDGTGPLPPGAASGPPSRPSRSDPAGYPGPTF